MNMMLKSLTFAVLVLSPMVFGHAIDFPEENEEEEAVVRDAEGRRCVPLPECEGLMYLIKRVRESNDIPGMSRADVFE